MPHDKTEITFLLLGYRKIWQIVRSRGIPVTRQSVMEIVKDLDPEGVQARKKKRLRRRTYSVPGPNFMWHIDGYDKLKPYGFCVHGCIDGFSRRLIWLEVGKTNKQPVVIAQYYLQAVKQLKVVPTRIRSDDGTENAIIEAMHIALRSGDNDAHSGVNSFIVGTSPANQKIESFWSQLAKDRPSWWRNFFKELTDCGVLDAANPVIADCIRFCFMAILRRELYELIIRWNQHILAPSKSSTLTRGRPDSLFFLPELFGTSNHAKNVDQGEIDLCESITEDTNEDYSEEFKEFVEIVLGSKGRATENPTEINEAVEVYAILIEAIEYN